MVCINVKFFLADFNYSRITSLFSAGNQNTSVIVNYFDHDSPTSNNTNTAFIIINPFPFLLNQISVHLELKKQYNTDYTHQGHTRNWNTLPSVCMYAYVYVCAYTEWVKEIKQYLCYKR